MESSPRPYSPGRRRFVPAALTLMLAALCWSFTSGPQVWLEDVAGATNAARAARRVMLVHVTTPQRPLDVEVRHALASGGVAGKVARSFEGLRVPASEAARVGGLCGEPAAVALVVVHPDLGPLATWYGGGDLRLAEFLAAALRAIPAFEAAGAVPSMDPIALLHRAALHAELASPALAKRALTAVTELAGVPATAAAEAWARLARLHAQAGATDHARHALACCRARTPTRAGQSDCLVTEAIVAAAERQPAISLALLAAITPSAGDRPIVALVRADAMHQLGRAGESLDILYEVLADPLAVLFHDTARAAIAHLLAPDHGHTH